MRYFIVAALFAIAHELRLVDELGDVKKSRHAVLCIPADCTYSCINDYNLNDVKVVVAES